LLAAVLSIGVGAAESERIDLGGGVSLEIVKVPSGSFEMGSPSAEAGRGRDEDRHRVTIAEDFWMGRTPVTRGQFARFVQDAGYKTDAEKGPSGGFGFDGTGLVQKKEYTWRNPGFPQTDDHPVVIVTYDDALAFTRWLARKSGRRVSLPTEAQWEYACRAGTTSRFYSGDADSDAESIAWFEKNAGNTTHPVAEKAANALGLHDMSGNVYEWCSDLYVAYVPGGGEQGPIDKPRRVLRGGSWLKDARHVRSAARARNTPGSRNADNGFRVVIGDAVKAAAPAVARPAPVEAPPTPVEPPPAEPEPVPTPIRVRESDNLMGCSVVFFIVLIVAAALIAFVVMKFRRRSVPFSPAPVRSLRGIPPRIVEDGFWFDTSGYNSGDVVTYTYTGRNGTVTEQFMVDPGAREQFVYTGIRPGDIFLANLIARQLDQQQPPPSPPLFRPSTSRTYDDPPRRHPPAY
jgi:formylglycine-generating enzyme required for sulfatase activity